MIRLIVVSIIGGAKLIFRLGLLAPNLLYQRRKSLAIFRSQLYASGIEKDVVRELTGQYKQMGGFKQLLDLVPDKK